MYVHGCFFEVSAPEKLVYTWNWENAFLGMPETRVTVQFAESDGGTEVVLVHEELPELQICLRHWNGWLAALDRARQLYV